MVNPFDPMQPNPDLPTLPQMGAQPFALSRPSAAERTLVSPEQLFPQEARSRAYFQKMALPFAVTPFLEKSDGGSDDGDGGDGGTGGSGGGGDGGDGGRGTRAGPYTTGTAPPHNPDFHLDYDYD
jgi:hypothetical protein